MTYFMQGVEKSKHFVKLDEKIIEKIKPLLISVSYEGSQKIIGPDDMLERIFFLVDGEMTFTPSDPDQKPISIKKGLNFGESFLVPKSRLRSPVNGTLKMLYPGTCYELPIKDLYDLLGMDLESYLNTLKMDLTGPNEQNKVVDSIKLELKDLEFIKWLGDGVLG